MSSNGATLHSRLRVLVAKTFRAEQLYASMRHSGKEGKPVSFSEVSSDLRANVWLRSHKRLRTALNEALALSTHSSVASRVQALKQHFQEKARESELIVEKGTERLIETAKRHEFALVLKLSHELIQHKARAQANAAIAEELADILHSSGRAAIAPDPEVVIVNGELTVDRELAGEKAVEAVPSNVIPLRRAAGARVGRLS